MLAYFEIKLSSLEACSLAGKFLRYTPGYQGKGAMVIDMQEKGRYPGDAMGQCAVGGVRSELLMA